MLRHNKSYLGTVAHDTIKPIPKHKNSSQIINLHKSHQRGSHFVCYYNDVSKDFINYYDSYGLMPSNEIQNALRKTGKKIIYSSHLIQNNTSNRCGFYCFAFIEYLENGGSMFDFINLFKHKGKNNDEILMRLLL